MNIQVNWLGVQETDAGALLDRLGLQEVGAANDPDRAAYAYTFTDRGWLIVASRSFRLKLKDLLPGLSADRAVVAGEVSDVAMASTLQAWSGGAKLWSVRHDPEGGAGELEVSGDPPAEFAEIRSRLTALEAAEEDPVDHLFDAPLELGDRVCGYRADRAQPGPRIELAPRRKGTAASALPAAIRSRLWPALAELGWRLEPTVLPGNGRGYDATRVRSGRREAIRLLWRDDRRELEVIPSYAVLDGEAPDRPVLVSGTLHRTPPTAPQRAGAWFAALGRRAPTYEERVQAAVDEALADLPDTDRFITEDAVKLLG